ncbi:heat shock factor-binding protein 1-like [Styela clava]
MADTGSDPKSVQDLTTYVQHVLQDVQVKFQGMSDGVLTRIDEMGEKLDDLEKSIAELMAQAGVDDLSESGQIE